MKQQLLDKASELVALINALPEGDLSAQVADGISRLRFGQSPRL